MNLKINANKTEIMKNRTDDASQAHIEEVALKKVDTLVFLGAYWENMGMFGTKLTQGSTRLTQRAGGYQMFGMRTPYTSEQS